MQPHEKLVWELLGSISLPPALPSDIPLVFIKHVLCARSFPHSSWKRGTATCGYIKCQLPREATPVRMSKAMLTSTPPHTQPTHPNPTKQPSTLFSFPFPHTTHHPVCLLYEHFCFLSLRAVECKPHKGTAMSTGPAATPGAEKPSANIY